MPDLPNVVTDLAWLLLLAMLGGVAVAAWQAMYRLWLTRLLPVQRRRAVPWTELDVALACLAYLLIPALIHELLRRLGFFHWLYGPDFAAAGGSARDKVRQDAWLLLTASPLSLGVIVLLVHLRSGALLFQLGLSWAHWRRNLAAGAVAWLLFSPLVYLLFLAVGLLLQWLSGVDPEPHQFFLLAQEASVLDWVLLVLVAVVWAPVLEELLFRGLLQPVVMRRPRGGEAALAAALAVALGFRADKLLAAGNQADSAALLNELAPAVFVLVLTPGYFLAGRLFRRWLPEPRAARAIYATALLFAMFHTQVWPSPIPLFLLGLVLGFLAYRTQNLVGPMVLHALFNGTSCVGFLFAQGTLPPARELFLPRPQPDALRIRPVDSMAPCRPVRRNCGCPSRRESWRRASGQVGRQRLAGLQPVPRQTVAAHRLGHDAADNGTVGVHVAEGRHRRPQGRDEVVEMAGGAPQGERDGVGCGHLAAVAQGDGRPADGSPSRSRNGPRPVECARGPFRGVPGEPGAGRPAGPGQLERRQRPPRWRRPALRGVDASPRPRPGPGPPRPPGRRRNRLRRAPRASRRRCPSTPLRRRPAPPPSATRCRR